MIGGLISLILTLIIVGVIYWAFTQLIGLVPLPAPFATVIHVLLVVILVVVVIYVIMALLGMAGISGGPNFRTLLH